MLRSLLLVTAGAASGWLAHRALGDRAATDAAPGRSDAGPQARPGRARLDPEHLARQAGQAAGDAAAAALNEGARRLADRVRAEAPWAAQFLPHTGPIIEGETVEPPSPSGPGGPRPQTTIPTTTTQKDTHA